MKVRILDQRAKPKVKKVCFVVAGGTNLNKFWFVKWYQTNNNGYKNNCIEVACIVVFIWISTSEKRCG